MKMNRNMAWPAIMALATVAAAPLAHGAIMHQVTGWAVHNGSSTVSDGSTNSPTFTAADNITAMGTFPDVQLANDGDYVKVTTTLTLAARTANTGVNALNTQLRIGLFDGPAGAVAADDVPNLGIFIEYSNLAAGGLIREQTTLAQTNPFTSPTNIGNGVQDTGGDSIRGADIGPVDFELTLTRNAGMLDITGQISGTDSSNGNPYLSTYTLLSHTPATVGFNRVGFLFGGNVDAPNGTLNNVLVMTNVPEPSSCMLAATLAVAGVMARRQQKVWR